MFERVNKLFEEAKNVLGRVVCDGCSEFFWTEGHGSRQIMMMRNIMKSMMSYKAQPQQQIRVFVLVTIINLLARMSGLDQVVKKIYGDRLKLKDSQKYVHHLYTLYEDIQTKEHYYLRSVKLSAFLHISDGIAELSTKKYQNLLTPTKIIPIDQTFQQRSYLLRATTNIILFTNFLQVTRECTDTIEIQLFRKFVLFLLSSYQILDKSNLPLFTINQIGITDLHDFTLCDPSLYFRNAENDVERESFGGWVKKLIQQFISLPLNEDQYQDIIKQKFETHFHTVFPFITYLLSGDANLQGAQNMLKPIVGRMSEDATTVTSSYMDVNQIFERATKSGVRKNKVTIKKINKLGRALVIFIIIGILVGAGYFIFNFFQRKITCEEGFYVSTTNQCVGCSDGCSRCEDSSPNKCMKCSINMYLVLDEEQDKEGFCLKQCRGKLISMDVCVKQKLREEVVSHSGIQVNISTN